MDPLPGEGFEPSRPEGQWILSPLRLPFRHPGVGSIVADDGKDSQRRGSSLTPWAAAQWIHAGRSGRPADHAFPSQAFPEPSAQLILQPLETPLKHHLPAQDPHPLHPSHDFFSAKSFSTFRASRTGRRAFFPFFRLSPIISGDSTDGHASNLCPQRIVNKGVRRFPSSHSQSIKVLLHFG